MIYYPIRLTASTLSVLSHQVKVSRFGVAPVDFAMSPVLSILGFGRTAVHLRPLRVRDLIAKQNQGPKPIFPPKILLSSKQANHQDILCQVTDDDKMPSRWQSDKRETLKAKNTRDHVLLVLDRQ